MSVRSKCCHSDFTPYYDSDSDNTGWYICNECGDICGLVYVQSKSEVDNG
jgi:hypothetical protein